MLKRVLTTLFLAICLRQLVTAQTDAHFTHYWAVENFYNPAAMNRNSKLNLTGSYAMQMAGYRRAPHTIYFGANSVLPHGRGRHSGGIGFYNESIGLFSHRRILFNYAYKLTLGKGWLNVGAGVGVLGESFNSKDLEVIDTNDPAFPDAGEDGTSGTLGLGLLYVRGELYFSAAVSHLNSPTVTYGKGATKTAKLEIPPSLYFGGGCNIQLNNPLLSLQPCFQVNSNLNSWRTDITLRGKYEYERTMFYAGMGYSPKISVTLLLGGRVTERLTVGYAFELFTSGVGLENGSHDLLVNYSMDVDFFKRGKNFHKSVRYL